MGRGVPSATRTIILGTPLRLLVRMRAITIRSTAGARMESVCDVIYSIISLSASISNVISAHVRPAGGFRTGARRAASQPAVVHHHSDDGVAL